MRYINISNRFNLVCTIGVFSSYIIILSIFHNYPPILILGSLYLLVITINWNGVRRNDTKYLVISFR